MLYAMNVKQDAMTASWIQFDRDVKVSSLALISVRALEGIGGIHFQ